MYEKNNSVLLTLSAWFYSNDVMEFLSDSTIWHNFPKPQKRLISFRGLTFSTLKSRYLANSLYNLDGDYDVMNKINRAEYDVIINILLKATKECSVLKVKRLRSKSS